MTELIKLHAPTIAYISCDAATLARDAQILSVNGYELILAQPFDMFPQTHHVETLALFATRPAAGMQ
jgi:23S rRNA (uracil1939-C5)-methyltransferase